MGAGKTEMEELAENSPEELEKGVSGQYEQENGKGQEPRGHKKLEPKMLMNLNMINLL